MISDDDEHRTARAEASGVAGRVLPTDLIGEWTLRRTVVDRRAG